MRRVPRLLAIVGVGLFVALLAYGLASTSPDETIDERLRDGQTAAAPAFDLELLEFGSGPARLVRTVARAGDGRLSLDELRGTPFVLNFWASWCSPCREEAGVLESGWRRWNRRGVLFLGLDMQDLRGDARDFLREQGVTYPTIRDPGKDVANDYGATGIPETYFVSGRARVVGHVVGVISAEQVDAGVRAARAGRPIGRQQGGELRDAR